MDPSKIEERIERIRKQKEEEQRQLDRENALIAKVTRSFTDDQLRETLAMPPESRNEEGIVADMTHVHKYVPQEFEEENVDEDLATFVLAEAAQMAIDERLKIFENYVGLYFGGVEDGYRRIYLNWEVKEIELPDYLKDLPILELEEWVPFTEKPLDPNWHVRVK